jgi:hypothetical protein
MKKIFLTALAITAAAVTHVSALTVTVDIVQGYQLGSGGEFNVSPVTGAGYSPLDLYNNNSGALGFGTFCVDRNTDIKVPGTYTGVVDPNGVTSSGNHISLGTAWLFKQFATGVLNYYSYTPGYTGSNNHNIWKRADSAYFLQLAIWYLEGTYGYQDPSVNPFLNLVKGQFGTLLAAEGNANGAYGVGVLNLYSRTGGKVQPMLTLLPDGGSALILLGMALSSMAVIARKFRS